MSLRPCHARRLAAAGLVLATMLGAPVNAWGSTIQTRLPNGEPILRLPFPSGTVVLCQQGNRSPMGFSHSDSNCLHALDLSNPTGEAATITAAADGTVASVHDRAKPGDANGGAGFGNYVKLDHGQGYFTFYAHLAAVSVRVGERVKAGQRLGTMGDTGKAGNPHLHFSLHRGNPKLSDPGVGATVPMHALIAADMDVDGEFALLTSLELVDAGATLSPKGHLYGSENQPDTGLHLGRPSPTIANRLAAATHRLRQALGKAVARDTLATIIEEWQQEGAQRTRARLDQLVANDPLQYEAWYWIAVASLRDLGDYPRAQDALARILTAGPDQVPPTSWLLPWTHQRAGELAEAQGNVAAAKAAYAKALSFADDGTGFTDAARAALSRLSGK